ncbi:nucleotidyl transferase AbiEii/AbiGii toxin family protein [Rhabdochlamydiaceae symbiont of Dictyostelium giganteum]|uniref:nucleotidyl transferase AbiEii/AbiGii toxin family protein n=1 Tax=Rhabdochlamydiaceae symbiont of Dictyostelium giganteum TaxID=3342349 RepID=UPI00384D1B16
MKSAIEQSIKEKIKALASERNSTFVELWRNLILERLLTRLSNSSYKEKFILKGGTLLAKYIDIGRETQDLDFFIQKLSNTEQALKGILQAICDVEVDDSFSFEVMKIKVLDHSQLAYTGAEITLQAVFGATKTVIRMDLGFGDSVEPIEHQIDLTATSKGPLFESSISLYCYPKEFIFAEKLETVVFRGKGNTRMKDFHDLYSLVQLGISDQELLQRAIQLVFHHRKTSLKKLPIFFEIDAFEILEKNWSAYLKKIQLKKERLRPPESIKDVILAVNRWLEENKLF